MVDAATTAVAAAAAAPHQESNLLKGRFGRKGRNSQSLQLLLLKRGLERGALGGCLGVAALGVTSFVLW